MGLKLWLLLAQEQLKTLEAKLAAKEKQRDEEERQGIALQQKLQETLQKAREAQEAAEEAEKKLKDIQQQTKDKRKVRRRPTGCCCCCNLC